MMRAIVRDSSDHQLRFAVVEHDVLVHQHVQPQTPQLVGPRALAGVVLVIAGDKVSAVRGAQSRQRFDVRRKFSHAAIDQVAGDRNRVGFEPFTAATMPST